MDHIHILLLSSKGEKIQTRPSKQGAKQYLRTACSIINGLQLNESNETVKLLILREAVKLRNKTLNYVFSTGNFLVLGQDHRTGQTIDGFPSARSFLLRHTAISKTIL